MQITTQNYFHNYIINAFSKDLTNKQKAFVFLTSLFLGFATLGIAHAIACGLKGRKVKPLNIQREPQTQPQTQPQPKTTQTTPEPQPTKTEKKTKQTAKTQKVTKTEPKKEKAKPLTFDEEVAFFRSYYEDKYLKGKPVERGLQVKIPKDAFNKKADLSRAKDDLASYTKDMATYVASQENIISLVNTSLQNLTTKPQNEKDIASAKIIYKTLSGFFRKYLPADQKENYKEYHSDAYMRLLGFSEKNTHPVDFIAQNSDQEKYLHRTIYFLLKHLRKQIKLATKQDKIKQLINSNAKLKEIPQALIEKAFKYLSITWAHGTKLFTLKSACENTGQQILPTGELLKQKLNLLNGELHKGATKLGINVDQLSGVNLSSGRVSKSYAQGLGFNLKEENRNYEIQKTRAYTKWEHVCVYVTPLDRYVLSMRRIRDTDPERFKRDLPIFLAQRDQIRTCISETIFKPRVKEIYGSHDDGYHSEKLYASLNALEEYERLLTSEATPIDKKDQDLANTPLIIATSTQYGYPLKPSVTKDLYEEPSEETLPGGIKFGEGIKTIFVEEKDRGTAEALLKQHGLTNEVAVENMDVFDTAVRIDQELSAFFYDVYNIKKWEAGK